jgi:hypothetical protein
MKRVDWVFVRKKEFRMSLHNSLSLYRRSCLHRSFPGGAGFSRAWCRCFLFSLPGGLRFSGTPFYRFRRLPQVLVDERQLFLSRIVQLGALPIYRRCKAADIPPYCCSSGLRHILARLLCSDCCMICETPGNVNGRTSPPRERTSPFFILSDDCSAVSG